MTNMKQRRELAEVMRKIEGDISRVTGELKALKAQEAGNTGYLVRVTVDGLDDSDGPALRISLQPPSICEGGASSGILGPSAPLEFIVMSAQEGVVEASTSDKQGATITLGSWSLANTPLEEEVCLNPEGSVQRLVKIKVEATALESLASAIAAKESEISELSTQRKEVKAAMADLQVSLRSAPLPNKRTDTPFYIFFLHLRLYVADAHPRAGSGCRRSCLGCFRIGRGRESPSSRPATRVRGSTWQPPSLFIGCVCLFAC